MAIPRIVAPLLKNAETNIHRFCLNNDLGAVEGDDKIQDELTAVMYHLTMLQEKMAASPRGLHKKT